MVEDIGTWGDMMSTISKLGVVVNVGAIVFSTTSFERYSFHVKLILFLITEQTLLLVGIGIKTIIPQTSDWVEQVLAQY